ncbi:12788_t:CDS:2 [Entrophospora sp. SA101]|nr:184_t:CDS:2 [Entrophospora sp. SA101]CAJ0629957.1 12788_t:CDS:2 [Entrophospora sp. SA101]CAJ0827848.1 19643_t:CDS:2 [Entrophospora sp. SA101]
MPIPKIISRQTANHKHNAINIISRSPNVLPITIDPDDFASSTMRGKHILVLGATGRLGTQVVNQALEASYHVTALVRNDSNLPFARHQLRNPNLVIMVGSVLSRKDLDKVIEGQDVVINCIGPRLLFPSSDNMEICSCSQKLIIESMIEHKVRRLIVVTSQNVIVNIPQEYILPGVNRIMLERQNLNIDQLCQNDYVKTFIYKLHKVVKNAGLDIGTSEASTDTLVANLIFRVIDFDKWPLVVKLHPTFKFSVGNAILSAKAEFVINYQNYSLLVVENKHLNNIKPTYDYGEPQIIAEILACGDENICKAHGACDMTIFVVHVVSTYVTFYCATINKRYWNELAIDCPQQQSITVLRWPGNSSDPIVGFDLAEPNGRRDVLEALSRIRQYILS